MAKPICIVKIDPKADLGFGGRRPNIHEIEYGLQERMKDYYVYVLWASDNDEKKDPVQFQVFHEKDFTDIQYAELKKIIEDAMPKKPNE